MVASAPARTSHLRYAIMLSRNQLSRTFIPPGKCVMADTKSLQRIRCARNGLSSRAIRRFVSSLSVHSAIPSSHEARTQLRTSSIDIDTDCFAQYPGEGDTVAVERCVFPIGRGRSRQMHTLSHIAIPGRIT